MSTILAIIAVLLPTYLVRFELGGIPSTLLEVLIWLGFASGVVHVFRDRRLWQRLVARRVWCLPALLLLVGASLGVLVSPDLPMALGLWKGFILDPLLVYLLALTFVATSTDRDKLIAGLLVGATAVAIWALVGGVTDGTGRFLGPYGLESNASPNYLAFAIAPLLPLLVYATTKSRWSLVALPLFVAALMVSGSRAGLLAGVAGLGVALVLGSEWLWRTRSARTSLVVVLLLGALTSWWVVKPDFTLSPEAGGRTTASTNVRFQLWSATGELVRQHWLLGVGLGNFQRAFDDLTQDRVNYPEFITPEARTPHNLAIAFWLDATILGLIAYFAVLLLVGKALFRAVRSPQERGVAAALLGSWFVLVAHGLLDMPIWKNDGMVLFWLLIALAVPLGMGRVRAATR